jgi:hypothetical protein
MGLVSLRLGNIPPSAYFHPTYLLTQLSLVPQLEILEIQFRSPLPNRDVERQLLATPIMPHITLPNLRRFLFGGVTAYLEGLVTQISAPVLSDLQMTLFNQLTFPVPHLLQFMDTSETLSFSTVRLTFCDDLIGLRATQVGESAGRGYNFGMMIRCGHLDWQMSSVAQILDTLQPVFSVVETLTLNPGHIKANLSSEWFNEVDRTQWRQLLRSFSNLKTLRVENELIGKLAPSLLTDDGNPPPELLPNLKEVQYSGGDDARDAFTPFIDERRVAGHPVNLTMVDQSELWL